MDINLSTLLLVCLVALVSGLVGAAIVLLGVWLWWSARLASQIGRRGSLYLRDWDNERGRQLRAASDMATAMTFMRQSLKTISPEMAEEFTRKDD